MIIKTITNNGTYSFDNKYITKTDYEKSVSNSEEIRVGVAPSATFDFTLQNRDNILSNKKFDNCIVEYYNDNEELIGTFTSTVKKNKKTIDFECEDYMVKFDTYWRGCTFPISTYNLLLNLCNQVGVSLYTLKEDIINSDIVIDSEDGIAGKNCRDILKLLCELFGSYATITPSGQLLIKYYDFQNPKTTIEYSNFKSFKIGESECKRAGVLFINGEETYQVGDTSHSYIIEDNPIMDYRSDSEKEEIGTNITNKIKYTICYSGEFSVRTMDIAPGDVLIVKNDKDEEFPIIVGKIRENNGTSMTITSYGDTKNTSDSTSTSTSSKSKEEYSTEVYLGRGQNHQRIYAKAGTYTLAEKLISNITTFSKVNLNLFINFQYNQKKIIYFDIYANDKLAKSLKCETSIGFNQYSVGFLCDIDLDKTTNLFSCKITLGEDEEITIEPFECQMSFIVKSCKIEDAVAANQYFVEKYNKIDSSIFNQNRFTIKNLMERVEISIPLYTLNISKTSDDDVWAEWYENGLLNIYGTGQMKEMDYGIRLLFYSAYGTTALNRVKNETTKVIIGDGVTNLSYGAFQNMPNIESATIGSGVTIFEQPDIGTWGMFKNCTALKEVIFKGNTPLEIKTKSAFEGCTSLTTIKGSKRITRIADYAFKNCDITGNLDLSNCMYIQDYAFQNNHNLNYVKLYKPIKRLLNDSLECAFIDCTSMNSLLVLDNDSCGYAGRTNLHYNTFKNTQIRTIFFDFNKVDYFGVEFIKTINTDVVKTIYINNIVTTDSDKSLNNFLADCVANYNCQVVYYSSQEEADTYLQILLDEEKRYIT